jgi:prepilin-type N-terminal cleavage/methylation domain-containing protein
MMKHCANQKGFSFFELMIAIAVVGILSAMAIRAYQGYMDTANMTKVVASFEESMRVAVESFTRHKSRMALGIIETMPNSTEDWIAVFNPDGRQAPGSGPAFIQATENSKGDPITGAIGVKWTPAEPKKGNGKGKGNAAKKAKLQLWRPLYSTLEGRTAIISEDDLQIEKFEK